VRGAVIGFLLGLVAAGLLFAVELTTDKPAWLLPVSFPICWAVGGYLFQRWELWMPSMGEDDKPRVIRPPERAPGTRRRH
jgi:hypothetical protein